MDARDFDHLTKTLTTSHRRGLLGGMLGLAVTVLPGVSAAGNRKKKDKGKGGADGNDGGGNNGGSGNTCNAERKRGENCQQSCQCVGDYRCGEPRPSPNRVACGQNQNADQVCCLALGDACANDCYCCGTAVCLNGTCAAPTCQAAGRCQGCHWCLDLNNGTGLCVADWFQACKPCTSSSDCPDTWVCALSDRAVGGTDVKFADLCGLTPGTAVCVQITPC